MTKRKRRTGKQRLAILKAHDSKCYLCGGAIDPTTQKWELDHENALNLSSDDSDANLRPAHDKCHRVKTDDDVKKIAKAKRREVKHNGAKPAPRQKIKSPGFGRPDKPQRTGKPKLPPRQMYGASE
jgi:5-methylcytosine-specific restriction protein A